MIKLLIACIASLLGIVPALRAQEVIPADPPARWWKGNLHTHTLWSDGDDFPEMVAEWYRARGYNFLGLSDHNVLSQGQRWMRLADIEKRGGRMPLEKYLARFGSTWVETRGDPGRREGSTGSPREVRLKPLTEFRPLLEERGQFILIQAEEITDGFEGLPIHVNATNVLEVIKPQHGASVASTIENNVRAVEEQSKRTGQEMLPHLNHPNFGYAVTAEDLAEVVSDHFFEVFNGHPQVHQTGDDTHVSIERMWDIASALRIKRFAAPPLYGLATDDSHHYHVAGKSRSAPGRGWIMVRARHLTPESLLRAMRGGDFYASSGVTLRDVRFDPQSRALSVEIEPDADATFTTQFVGTTVDADVSPLSTPATQRAGAAATRPHVTQRYSDTIGTTFATENGSTATYRLTGRELYVRAIITSSKPHPNPTWEGQHQQAWTQPVGWHP